MSRYPFVAILIPFMIGIVLERLLSSLETNLLFWIMGMTLLGIILSTKKLFPSQHLIATCLVCVTFVPLGMFVEEYHTEKSEPAILERTPCVMYGEIVTPPAVKYGRARMVVRVHKIFQNKMLSHPTSMQVTIDDSTFVASYGEMFIFHGTPLLIANSGNPYEFDYRGYMLDKGISHKVFVEKGAIKKMDSVQSSFFYKVAEIKSYLITILKTSGLSPLSQSILSALILGDKTDLDRDTKSTYAETGASHVLAVSGLHVGILFVVFNTLFRFIKRFKRGYLYHSLVVILLLWGYAILTGLPPSVSRATFMFSLMQFAILLRRPTATYNALAVSAFFLLLVNPSWLFSVGFQLSYVAVWSIVFFQPKIERLLYIPFKPLAWAWSLFAVALAAQIGTLPITLFYFHQFPTYFWLSNFIVIPFAGVLIYLTLLLFVIHAVVPVITWIPVLILNTLIHFQNNLLEYIRTLPYAVFRYIYFDGVMFVLVILLLATLTFSWLYKKNYLLWIAAIIISIGASYIYKHLQTVENRSGIIVYNSYNTTLHLIDGKKHYVIARDTPLHTC